MVSLRLQGIRQTRSKRITFLTHASVISATILSSPHARADPRLISPNLNRLDISTRTSSYLVSGTGEYLVASPISIAHRNENVSQMLLSPSAACAHRQETPWGLTVGRVQAAVASGEMGASQVSNLEQQDFWERFRDDMDCPAWIYSETGRRTWDNSYNPYNPHMAYYPHV